MNVPPAAVPAAQASPDGNADTPRRMVSPVAPFGLGTADQAVPFQCSACVTFTGTDPLESMPIPMAQMSVADAALTPTSAVPGLATIDQSVPFQCSPTASSPT